MTTYMVTRSINNEWQFTTYADLPEASTINENAGLPEFELWISNKSIKFCDEIKYNLDHFKK